MNHPDFYRHTFYRYALVCILGYFPLAHTAAAQGPPINGNGTIIEQMRPLSNFTVILLDFSANVTIVNGETPSFRIEADENVLPFIGTKVRGRKLMITQDRWIEPSQQIVIHIGTPFTAKLETSGYSDVSIKNIDGPRLQIEAEVGKVTLEGKTERVQIQTKTGRIDARGLQVAYADVAISSHGIVRIHDVSELVANISETGTVVYNEPPEEVRNRHDGAAIISAAAYEAREAAEVQYIEITLFNNSRENLDLRVEGPQQRSFGYGFPLIANGTRKENWPVGTKVYKQGRLLADELLLTIDEDMADQQIKLFQSE